MKLIRVRKADKQYTGEVEIYSRDGVRLSLSYYDDGTKEPRFEINTSGILSGGEKEAKESLKVLAERTAALKAALAALKKEK